MTIPIIETDRLILRALHANDFDAYAEMVADPEVTKYLGAGNKLTREDAWRQLALIIGHWELRGFGLWAVERKDTGDFIGRIGCFEPEGWPGFEVGYTLARAHWGRGYAREGARAGICGAAWAAAAEHSSQVTHRRANHSSMRALSSECPISTNRLK